MSEQNVPPVVPPPIQFDRAEYAEAAGTCPLCKNPLHGAYFQVNETACCPGCAERVKAEWAGGSRVGRAFAAFGLGMLACVLGAALYFGIVAITGYELAIVAIVLGLGVGVAVRMGSRGRGGWFYQLMAVVLTYVSIGSAYSTMLIREIAKDPDRFFAKAEQIVDGGDANNSSTATSSITTQPAPTEGPATRESNSTSSAATGVTDASASEEPPSGGEMALAILMILALVVASIFALPVMACMESPITIVIIGFALYEAWKINKGRSLIVTGPFAVGAAGRAPPTVPPSLPGRGNG